LWEASSSDSSFSELGYVLTDVQAGPTLDGSWVAIFGNGYESASCQASLYVVNLETGARIREIKTNSGNCGSAKNGLGGVRLVRNANQQIIGVYAGDLLGNLWKFNLNNANSSAWSVDLGGSPLFTAGSSQPITAAPTVVSLSGDTNPSTGYMVVIGTGKFYEISDITTTTTQSIYGIWDAVAFGASTIPTGTSLTNKNLLVAQTFGGAQTGADGNTYFSLSSNTVDYLGKTTPTVVPPRRGWYIDLPNTGQRLVYPMDLLAGQFITADTISPANVSLDPCVNTSGGVGYFYYIDAFTGGGPKVQILDTNGDGIVNSADLLVSGIQTSADGRNVTISGDKTSKQETDFTVSTSAGAIKSSFDRCALNSSLSVCKTGTTLKAKSRQWRQLFMR
jgi:type IV pilus assembly protein PilY1